MFFIKNLVLVMGCQLIAINIFACSMVFDSFNYERKDDKIYYVTSDGRSGEKKSSFVIPNVNAKQFRLAYNSAKNVPDETINIWDDGNTIDNIFRYFTDDKYIYWQGHPLINDTSNSFPPVDVASFQQPFYSPFAFDKNSVYYNGKRLGDNVGIDKETLEVVDKNLMKDANNLYRYDGAYLGTNKGFQIVKSYFYTNMVASSCDPVGWEDKIYKTNLFVFYNLIPLEADSETFVVKRWMRLSIIGGGGDDMLLDYVDKNGQHTYVPNDFIAKNLPQRLENYYQQLMSNESGFKLLRDRVVYFADRRPEGKPYQPYIKTLDGVDPETFKIGTDDLTKGINGQYLYLLTNKKEGGNLLETLKLDTDTPIINNGSLVFATINYIVGKNHLYIVNKDNKVQTFKIVGKFVPIDHLSGKDDKYVYFFPTDTEPLAKRKKLP